MTNLDPGYRSLSRDDAACFEEMQSWSLEEIGTAALFAELGVASSATMDWPAALAGRFWL